MTEVLGNGIHGAERMPAAFVGHGSPMNALEDNRFTDAWRAFGASVPQPRAVVAISAHWFINATAVTAMARPRTIHDFYGFPQELFAFEYPAPGDPTLAGEIVDLVAPMWVGLDVDTWGFDHGTWSVLTHLFPQATVPVVQLSIDASKPASYHFELGARIAPLRERGVLVLCSGNIVHNLGRLVLSMTETGFDWAQRFDADVHDALVHREAERLVEQHRHPDYALAVPTPDHWLPLLYLAGLQSVASGPCEPLVEGFAYGSLSMASYVLRS